MKSFLFRVLSSQDQTCLGRSVEEDITKKEKVINKIKREYERSQNENKKLLREVNEKFQYQKRQTKRVKG